MTLQEILFIVSVVFFVLAAIFVVLAVVVFFVRNIPDVRADLSGKKRAAAVAEIAAQRPGRDRRKGVARVEPTTGTLASGGLGASPLDNPLNQVPHVESVVSSAPAQPAVVEQPKETYQPQRSYQVSSAAEEESDDSSTTILPEDDSSTTILSASDPAADATDDTPVEPAGDTPDDIPADPAGDALANPANDTPADPASDAPVETPAEPAGDALVDPVGAQTSAPAERSEARPDQDAAPMPDDSATTILPADDSETTILPSDDSATTILPEETAPAVPEGFVVVRKIILRESTEFITTG